MGGKGEWGVSNADLKHLLFIVFCEWSVQGSVSYNLTIVKILKISQYCEDMTN